MDEAERCDRIAIIDQGKIVAIDTPDALKASVGADVVTLATADNARVAEELMAAFAVETAQRNGTLEVRVPDGEEFVPKVFGAISVGVRSVSVRRPSLDDVFITYTGRAIRDAEVGGMDLFKGNAMVRGFRRG